MRALVTNDDGITSPGIRALAEAARDAGLGVTVAAPSWDSSGASASLTAVEKDGRLLVEHQRLDGLDDVAAFSVEAAPAYIVRAAIHGAFGEPPDIVLSGINNGHNTGYAVLHSGTVGAALTAATFGRAAAAFSIGAADRPCWETAKAVARSVLPWLVQSRQQIVLNVNIPDLALGEVRGLVAARLAAFGAVQTNVTELGEGYVKLEYSELSATHQPGTDAALLAEGYACYTPLRSVCEADAADTSGLNDALRADARSGRHEDESSGRM